MTAIAIFAIWLALAGLMVYVMARLFRAILRRLEGDDVVDRR